MNSGNWVSASLPYLVPNEGGQGDAWAAEAAARGGRGTHRIALAGAVQPPVEVARLLGLPAGEAAVVRQRIVCLNDRPVERADSYYPAAIAGGTALAEPRKIPGGAVALLAQLGFEASRVQEDVTARRPSREECAMFELSEADPVLELTRLVRDSSDRPIQVDVLVTPAAVRRYRYELRID